MTSATWPVEQRKSKCSRKKQDGEDAKWKRTFWHQSMFFSEIWLLIGILWDSSVILIINLFLLNLVQIFFYHQFVITNYIWLNILEDSKLIHYFVVNINCNKNLSTYNTMVLEHCQEILVKWIETSDFLVNAYWWALFIGRWEG